MTKRLLRSLSFIDPGTDIHFRRFEAMCVLRKGQNVTLKTLSTLWNVDIFVAEKEVKVFDRFSIVRCFDDDSGEMVAGLHDIILDISRARAGDSVQNHSLGLIKRFLSIGKRDDADEAAHALTGDQGGTLASEEFQQEAVAIGSDKYMLSNLCWLLKLGGMKADLLWLVSQPSWIVKRLNAENGREVLGDVEMASEVLSDISMNSREEQVARDWLYRLTICLQLSMSSIISNPHRCMPWFQLYGRLMHSNSKNSMVRDFVQRIEADAPKPWMKPAYGCLPPAGENLKTVVDTPGDVLCFLCGGGLISVISRIGTEVVNTVHDANDGTELERYVLAVDVSGHGLKTSFSNGGKTFVCGTPDGRLRVWTFSMQAAYSEESKLEFDDPEISSHQANVQQIEAEKPRASKLVDFGQKISFKLKQLKKKAHHSEAVTNQECNPEILAEANVMMRADESGSINEICQKEQIETGEIKKKWDCVELNGHTEAISCVALSTDGKLLVSGSDDNTVRVWEFRDGKWDDGHCLIGHTASITCVAISTDGKQVVSGSADETVRVWENRDGKWDNGHCLIGHTGSIACMAISIDGKQVVSGSWDKTVWVWEFRDGKWDDGYCLLRHITWTRCVAISTDGKQVVSGSDDNTVRVWKNRDGKWDDGHCLTGHSLLILCVAISTDGKHVVSASDDDTVRVWKNRDGNWDDGYSLTRHTERITSVAVSTDGTQVVSGSGDRTVLVWENRDGEWDDGRCLSRRTGWIRCVAISTDRKQVVSGSDDSTVCVWEFRDGKWDDGHCLSRHTGWILCVAISTDGKQVVSGSDDSTVCVWKNRDGKWDDGHCLTGNTGWIGCVAISTDGKQVVSGSADKTVRVWENVEGKWEDGHCLTGHTGWIGCVAISGDGKLLVSGSDDNTVRVWEFRDGKWDDGHCLIGHTASITCVAISTDGKQVVSGSHDRTVRVWKNRDGKWDDGHCLIGHTAWIRCVDSCTDGEYIRSECRNGAVLRWRKRNDVWSLWNKGRKLSYDRFMGFSQVTLCSDASDGLKSADHNDSESVLKLSGGKNLSGVEEILEILDIDSVRNAVRGSNAWIVSNGYCVKLEKPPFLLFINLEK